MANSHHHKPCNSSTLIDPLRLVLVISYIPSIPLGIVHGVLAHRPVPALGLLPLTVSAATAVAAYHFRASIRELDEDRQQRHDAVTRNVEEVAGVDADNDRRHLEDEDTATAGARDAAANFRAAVAHPITVFFYDVVLAASMMVVLVFTWITHGHRYNPDLSMLAAYATLPLLVNFFIHSFLALRALARGLAIRGLVQWTAWRALPADCPHCNVRLRPSLPELPWLKFLQQQSRRRRARHLAIAPVQVAEQDRYRDDIETARPAAARPAAQSHLGEEKGPQRQEVLDLGL